MMLQTCSRCRQRRSKCDSLLPACSNCAKNDLECTFRDDALQEDVPRRYIQKLQNRIQELNSQLALQSHDTTSSSKPINGSSPSCDPASLSIPPHSQPLQGTVSEDHSSYVLIPGPRPAVYRNISFPSIITRVVFECLPPPGSTSAQSPSLSPETAAGFEGYEAPVLPDLSQFNEAILTPGLIRYLLGSYERCMKPHFNIVESETLSHSGEGFKKLPSRDKFTLLMTCAIAAARESYKNPSWRPLAQVCREWADGLVSVVCSGADTSVLQAALLLLVYELAEPSRGIFWQLLDFAKRTCIQLGWYRRLNPVPGQWESHARSDNEDKDDEDAPNPLQDSMLSTLSNINWSMRVAFDRPSLLNDTRLLSSAVNQPWLTHARLFDELYGEGNSISCSSCPFVGNIASLISQLEDTSTSEHIVQLEAWILLLPLCVTHKECFFCFQEAGDRFPLAMKSLQERLLDAASLLVNRVHNVVAAADGFMPPVLIGARTMVAGCTLATGISMKWAQPYRHIKELMKCSELLSISAPTWQGGEDYLQIWRQVVERLDLAQ